MSNLPQKLHYISSFDSLRGFAVVLVLLVHGSYGVLIGGWIGVDLFFVLSGYLITSLLLKEYSSTGDISLSNFYIRRALRLFPALVICVLLSNILWPFTNFDDPVPNQITATSAALFYFTNLIRIDASGNMCHLWSLSVEEHFYIFWPIIIIALLTKFSYRTRIVFLLSAIVGVSIFKIFVFNFIDHREYGFLQIDSYRFTLCGMDTVLIGALLAFLLSNDKVNHKFAIKRRYNTLSIVAIFLVFIILLFTLNEQNPYYKNGAFILLNLLCAATVLIALRNPFHYMFSNKLLLWGGKRSYGIYLYHLPVFLVLEHYREANNFSNFIWVSLIRVLASVAIAAASFKFIEEPVLRLKKRYDGKKLVVAGTPSI